VSPIFSLDAKRSEKVAKLGEAKLRKKGLFRIFSHNSENRFTSEKVKRKEAKRSETKRNEAKKRLYVSEKANIIIF
jgi:hypothetical protein